MRCECRQYAMLRIGILVTSLVFLVLPVSVAWALSPYIVFFESGSAQLTSATNAVLDNAVTQWRQVPLREVILHGHADRSGDNSANLALSLRRAEAVRNGLIERGLPSGIIRMEAHGEDQPLVDTPDGAAEAQNRRVEIVITPACGYWSPPPSPAC